MYKRYTFYVSSMATSDTTFSLRLLSLEGSQTQSAQCCELTLHAEARMVSVASPGSLSATPLQAEVREMSFWEPRVGEVAVLRSG